MSRPIETRDDVMKSYLLLQVIEERAITQLPQFVEGFAEVDSESAKVFSILLTDETRHLGYCRAMARRYAPNEKLMNETLRHYRHVEAMVFGRGVMTNLTYVLDKQLLQISFAMKCLWRLLTFVSMIFPTRVPTPFSQENQEKSETSLHQFERSVSAEDSHRQRRKNLLRSHPEIRSLFGFDRRTIVVTMMVALAQFSLAALIQIKQWPLWSVVFLAYFVGAILSHWLGQSIHETSHHLAARSKLANRALAWFANLPMVVPIAETFHQHHLLHHARLGVEGVDTDLPLDIEVKYVGRNSVSKLVWLAFYPVVYFARGAAYALKGSQRYSKAEWVNLFLMVAVNVAIYAFVGPTALLFLFLSMYFGHALHPVAAHFIHEHYLFSGHQETYSYYGPLNWVTFNVGYHVEHHDFMNIPGWNLPAYRAMTGNTYDALVSHDSWSGVLIEFVMRNDLGPWSRLVRATGLHS